MITCEFKGRLANYMFQIAATYGAAAKFNDSAEFEKYIYSSEFKSHYPQGMPEWWTDFGLPERSHRVDFVFEEKGSRYQEIPHMPNMMLKGFFQSYKYFDHIKQQLQDNIFAVPHNRNVGAVGIHIRRTDYFNYPDYFPVLPKKYYMDAIKQFAPDRRLLFYSDDLEYCRKEYGNLPNAEFIAGSPLHDIMSLANCDDFIIANSSFSWMAAYLCRNENKTVICPHKDQWYGKLATIDTTDFIPDSWKQTKIKY